MRTPCDVSSVGSALEARLTLPQKSRSRLTASPSCKPRSSRSPDYAGDRRARLAGGNLLSLSSTECLVDQRPSLGLLERAHARRVGGALQQLPHREPSRCLPASRLGLVPARALRYFAQALSARYAALLTLQVRVIHASAPGPLGNASCAHGLPPPEAAGHGTQTAAVVPTPLALLVRTRARTSKEGRVSALRLRGAASPRRRAGHG